MEYGKWLIDRAAERCDPPTHYELCRRAGLHKQNLSAVYNGHRMLPTEWVGPIAVLAGIDPGEAVLRVIAERAESKKAAASSRSKRATRVLGAAAMLLFSYGGATGLVGEARAAVSNAVDTMCIMSNDAPILPSTA